ncbi:MAG: GNAT family N-acetyltransferase [Caulobacterales bacterium]
MQPGHPLDRPVWNALTTRQAGLGRGDGQAVRLDPEYGLFAAAVDGSPGALAALAALVPDRGGLALVETAPPPPIPGAAAAEPRSLWQMVADHLTAASPPDFEITPLTDADAPRMLALARLTEPGPFFARTHQLGDFVGVKQEGRLIAMAGERMKPTGFTEVSGVCTHPEHRGRGYAGALLRVVTARILARGETPFLHAYASNTGAIGLYQSLGFSLRRKMAMTVLTRG